eukprot:s1750_g6.t1
MARMKVDPKEDLKSVKSTDCMKGATTEIEEGVKEFSQCILHLFSGPDNRVDGFAAAVRRAGYECDEYDIVNGAEQDLAANQVWDKVYARIKAGGYLAMLAGPPCNTFTNARKDDGQGPKPLRAAVGPERYGLPDLSIENVEKVKLGNLFAERTCDAVGAMDDLKRPSIVEQPKLKTDEDSVSMYKLDEFIELRERPSIEMRDLVQCHYGADTTKPTTLLCCRTRPKKLEERCQHPKRLWRKPSTGEKHWGAHPPLVGKEWFIPAEDWDSSMLKTPEESRRAVRGLPYLTSAAQAYPSDLNDMLAEWLIESIKKDDKHEEDEYIKMGKWKLVRKCVANKKEMELAKTRHRMTFTTRTKGKKRSEVSDDEEEPRHLGGMRNPGRAVAQIPGYREAGAKIYEFLRRTLENNEPLLQRCIGAIGSEEEDVGPTSHDLQPIRDELNNMYVDMKDYPVAMAMDTELQAGLLWRVARSAGDPDADEIYHWLTEGAPAGIERPVTDPAQVFPPRADGEALDALDYVVEPENHVNYTSVDEDPMAEPEVQRLIATGFVWATKDYQEFVTRIDGRPHFSKLGMITKEKDNKIKRRLILDCKESGVNLTAAKGGRLTLPRATDAVDDALQLMRLAKPGQSIEWLVLDFTDWFFNIPLHPDERKHFTIKYKDRYLCYLTQAQGSVNAPIVCGRVAALVARLTQGMMGLHIMRMQLYVDDPCLCILGDQRQRDLSMAIVILFWRALGVKLAFKKSTRGTKITWIGAQYEVTHQHTMKAQVSVKAKQEIIDEIIQTTQRHMKDNVATRKSLQTYTGKLNHVAGIVETLRPFLTDLYGVLHKPTRSRAPPQCLWTKQWQHVTTWVMALLGSSQGRELRREYCLAHYVNTGLEIQITTDASPWGLGGVLSINHQTVACFQSPLTAEDEKLLRIEIGSSTSQQVAEALAALVALRCWKDYWKRRGVKLFVKSDSVSTLTLLAKLKVKAKSYGLGMIARELALEFGTCSFRPRFLQHIPGIANEWADSLSRQAQPNNKKLLPNELQRCRQENITTRSEAYYRALAAAKQGPE